MRRMSWERKKTLCNAEDSWPDSLYLIIKTFAQHRSCEIISMSGIFAVYNETKLCRTIDPELETKSGHHFTSRPSWAFWQYRNKSFLAHMIDQGMLSNRWPCYTVVHTEACLKLHSNHQLFNLYVPSDTPWDVMRALIQIEMASYDELSSLDCSRHSIEKEFAVDLISHSKHTCQLGGGDDTEKCHVYIDRRKETQEKKSFRLQLRVGIYTCQQSQHMLWTCASCLTQLAQEEFQSPFITYAQADDLLAWYNVSVLIFMPRVNF